MLTPIQKRLGNVSIAAPISFVSRGRAEKKLSEFIGIEISKFHCRNEIAIAMEPYVHDRLIFRSI